MKSKKSLFLISILFLLASCVSDNKIGRFYKVDQGLYRGAQPKEQGFKFLKNLGIKTVISLRTRKGILDWERSICSKYGLNFISIPLNAKSGISKKDAQKFLNIVLNSKYRPVFVHCQHGTDRTGCMVALYRIVYYNWSSKKAYKEALKFGFHRFYFKYREFILKDALKYYKEGDFVKKKQL